MVFHVWNRKGMKEEIVEIAILDEKGEKIDSIVVADEYYGYFLARKRAGAKENRVAFSKRRAKINFVLTEGILSFHEIEPVFSYLGFTQKAIAEILEVSPSTLSRWRKNDKGPLTGRLRSKFILHLDEIIGKGVKLFGSEEKFKLWLKTPNYALGGKEPVELLKDPYEMEKIDNAIEAMSWGNMMWKMLSFKEYVRLDQVIEKGIRQFLSEYPDTSS